MFSVSALAGAAFVRVVPACTVAEIDITNRRCPCVDVSWQCVDGMCVQALDAGEAGNGVDAGASSYAAAVLEDRPVAYWRLGERSGAVAKDELGRTPGTYSAGITLGQAGAVGDGDTAVAVGAGRLEIGDVFPFSETSSFSVELWVKPSLNDENVRFIFERGTLGTGENESGYTLRFAGAGSPFMEFLRFCATNDAGENGATYLVGGFASDHFRHVVTTYDGSRAALYLDGKLERAASTSVSCPSRPGVLVFGDRARGQTFKFEGALDEVAIYDKALLPGRVQRHYDAAQRR